MKIFKKYFVHILKTYTLKTHLKLKTYVTVIYKIVIKFKKF